MISYLVNLNVVLFYRSSIVIVINSESVQIIRLQFSNLGIRKTVQQSGSIQTGSKSNDICRDICNLHRLQSPEQNRPSFLQPQIHLPAK